MFFTQELPRIPGTKIKNRFLYSSTGLEALDSLLGGDGATSSSIILIDEPNSGMNSGYGRALQRYFLAEGAIHNHSIFIGDVESEKFLDNLPELIDPPSESTPQGPFGQQRLRDPDEGDMKIAWRYSTVPKIESNIGGNKSKFDLNKKMPKEKIHSCDIRFINELDYNHLWSELHSLLTSDQFSKEPVEKSSSEPSKHRKFLRVLLPNINQAYWGTTIQLKQLMTRLKVFSRYANVIILATLDSKLTKKEEFDSLVNYSDAVFRLEIMTEEDQKIFHPEKVHGRFFVLKLPTITSIASYKPDLLDLTFYLDRHGLYVKILHLPPALGPEKNSNDLATKPKMTGCQTFQNEF